MMNLRKWMLVALAVCVTAGLVSADPVRTVFTKENRFPDVMGWEIWLGGGASSYDNDNTNEDLEQFFITPGVRFGLTDRLALLAEFPYVGYSEGDLDEKGLGDISMGMEFLFFEDIFEYAWIIPHADLILPTGNEDKGLGNGTGQGAFGLSIGTTWNDVLHYGADFTFTVNGAKDEHGEDDDLMTGALSIVWDLDAQASLIGEVQVRDDTMDPDDSYGIMGHGGLSFRVNDQFSLMVYGGAAADLAIDYYGMGRVVYSF